MLASHYVFVKIHDDEQTAGQAARAVLGQHGGLLVELLNGQQRLITFQVGQASYVADPNRIYTEAGRRATLAEYSQADEQALAALAHFAQQLLALLLQHCGPSLATVHNNTEGEYSILSYIDSPDAAAMQQVASQCIDDFFYVTEAQHYHALAALGYNVVLQHPHTVADDGSLSIVAAQRGLPYVNVEAMHGHLAQQQAMLQHLLPLL